KYRQKNKHRFSIHPLLVTRHDGKEFNIFISNLKKFEDKFFGYTRMSVKSYEELLTKLYLNIRGQDTRFRMSISPEEKLIITISDDGLAGGTRRLRLPRRVRGGDAARRIIQPARLVAAPDQPERLTAGRKSVRRYRAVSCTNRCAAYRNGTPHGGQPLVRYRLNTKVLSHWTNIYGFAIQF
ncbi:hypothetical protein HW555_008188, partial [Spodoptera exigua]